MVIDHHSVPTKCKLLHMAIFQRFFRHSIIERPAFLLHTAELANHFGPIWEVLEHTGFDILLDGEVQLHKAPERARIRTVREVLEVKDRYAVLVSNHIVRKPGRLAGVRYKKAIINLLAKTNLRMMYAAGKSGWNMSSWNSFYDGVLCFGPHHAQAFSSRFGLPTKQIGYPRFDNYFNTPIEKSKLCDSMNCDPAKPTVVWLPTWKNLSSVDHFNDEIAALMVDFNVVVKVHPLMPKDEPERVERLQLLGFNALITDDTDNVSLYQLADYMLFDYGGPAFGAIYTGKRFVLLNVPDAANDAHTGADSPDVLLRKSLINLDSGQGKLATYLQEGPHWSAHMEEIAKLRSLYFVNNFGTSAAAAAAAILDRSWLSDKGSESW